MNISLISASTVCFELLWRRHGHAIAEVLLFALSLDAAHLALFEPTGAGSRVLPASFWTSSENVEPPILGGRVPFAADPVDRGSDASAGLSLGLADLEHLIRADILGWCCGDVDGRPSLSSLDQARALNVANVLVGAIACLWVDSPRLRSGADRGFVRLLAIIGDQVETLARGAPLDDAVQAMLTMLTSPSRRSDLVAADLDDTSAGPDTAWISAMHEATWAVFTTGRVRMAAAAQLQAVRVLTRAPQVVITLGLWNVLSGHIQAAIVSDVLPEDTREVLIGAWDRLCSPRPGTDT